MGIFHNTGHRKQATRAHMDRESPSAHIRSAKRDMANYREEKTCGFHLVFGVREV